MRSPRFRRAATDARPYGTHRFDVFGPKVGRRLTLFGRRVFQLWLRLESNPQVVTYCERPLLVPEARGTRAADFWVCTDQGEQLHLVLRSSEAMLVEQGISLYPALGAYSSRSRIHPARGTSAARDSPVAFARSRRTSPRLLREVRCELF